MGNGKTYYILPEPYRMTKEEGSFFLNYNTEIVLGNGCGEAEHGYAGLLAETIKARTGITPSIGKGAPLGANEIYLERLPQEEEMPQAVKVLLGMEKGDKTFRAPSAEEEKKWKIKTESYRLVITKERICIQAQYEKGILYGIQTLRQLIDQLAMVLPCLTIEDKPSMANRGFYHDATRGRIQTLASYKKMADRLSYYKQNQLQLYVEHSYLFRELTEMWRDDTPLTAQEILELDSYCKKLGIELIPSLASFGHLDKLLKTKTYAPLCELEHSDEERFTFYGRMAHHTINIADEASWDLIRSMLTEFMALFSSRQFNLCGDETFDLGKGRSKELADKVGVHRMYVDFVKKICDYLIECGLRPMFWGDIIVGSPELIKELPESVVCLNWGYGTEERENNTRILDEAGATQYLCPGVHGWRHLMNRLDAAYANVSRMCSYAKKYKALGVLNTDWGDYGHASDPLFSVPGMIYGAVGAWCEEMPEREELNRRISLVEYGDRSETVTELLTQLGNQEGVCWEYIAQYMEYATDGREHSKENYQAFFDRMHVSEPAEKNVRLAQLSEQLAALAGGLNERGRMVLSSYLLHARGQMILNSVAGTIGARLLDKDFAEVKESVTESAYPVLKAVEEPKRLASLLERWFYEYKQNWRITCKESELYRVQNVIFWCADLLRSHAE